MGQLFALAAVKVVLAVQASGATIVGTVRDGETTVPLVGAVVALADLDLEAATDADGRYILRRVPAGPHYVTIRFIGYVRRTLQALVPPDGELEINVSLRPEPMRLPTLEGRGPVVVRGMDSGDSTEYPDRGSSIAAIRSDPRLAEPDVLQALGGGEVVLDPESPNGVHLRGGASDQTAYLLDGIPVFSPYHTAGMFSAWNPDALSRLQLFSSAPSPAYPDALSGTVAAVTRAPGARFNAQGSVSTAQARLTLDGPLGGAGAGYLVSVRSGFPGALAPKAEGSYLKGTTGDRLAKLETPALGGRLRLLGYDSDNRIDASAGTIPDDGSGEGSGRNLFQWHSRSFGAEWDRRLSSVLLRVRGWSASDRANSAWAGQLAPLSMTAARRDEGFLMALERGTAGTTTTVGVRIERSSTSYQIETDSGAGTTLELGARTTLTTPFAQHARAIGQHGRLEVGVSLASASGALHAAPRARLRWQPTGRVIFSGSYARLHQFAQSLRNPESVVGNIFPADLYLGVGAPGVPIARSDQGVIAVDYRPALALRLGAQGYVRRFDGLLLVAPRDGEPFTTGGFAVGSGASRGVSIDAALSAGWFAVIASYGLQHVRFSYGDSSYVPQHGITHLFEGGVIVFPNGSWSIRAGVTGALGRQTTSISGGFEWEACNLLDRGCEFSGSPHYAGQALGATALPAYLRVDLGLRKNWHIEVGGRDEQVGLFGTMTNVLGRKNLLTYAPDRSSGKLVGVEMRPLAPLVVGLDWRF